MTWAGLSPGLLEPHEAKLVQGGGSVNSLSGWGPEKLILTGWGKKKGDLALDVAQNLKGLQSMKSLDSNDLLLG